ncbi:peptide chain release factor 2 [Candidatus Korobacter versatilis]|uniref:peptide chain release factor 2 n=1 Tax=Candidatus Korobacter versatilis TaxID=658062 RepID=UPI0003258528|nr:peptide chain release factor 2 [Candidatus Koribacter versatilis]
MFEELEQEYVELSKKVRELKEYLDAPRLRTQLAEVEKEAADPNLWGNPENSQRVMRERKRLEDALATDKDLSRRTDDITAYFDLAKEGEDITADLRREMDQLRDIVEKLETETLLSGDSDRLSAIVTIHPGAGGTESQDWAEMLLRMYLRWAERQGFETTVNDYQPGEEAGLKSVTITVAGQDAYGLLTSEIGVHRLVRISPFDQAKRRHTSFASVFVSPEIDESIEVIVKPDDIRTDTYRSGGKGGQHVNTTDSAVRITHFPTGIVVSCQNERSQHKNRERAMKILRSKIYEYELEKKRAASQKVEDSKLDIDFGSQIRSYVLHPYRMVKDHRTKFEVGDPDRVLDGDLKGFIRAYLLMRRSESKGGDSAQSA